MKLHIQKRLAGQVMKCSPYRVRFDPTQLAEIKEAITKVDIKILVRNGTITRKNKKGISTFRSRKIKLQKRKGRQKGHGSRKGKHTARIQKKRPWINLVRNQRDLLRILRSKKLLDPITYRGLYNKSKGGFFRSRRHLHLYIEEHKLLKK